ncbi:(2Fe-2S)-binding protein [Alphaproteobacteria bacterium]|jgi:D-hydroxyproline dehydrogenase subunit gamma|nr:(2Fe-2S)-binding protein [Alphaproteobacteria bacterium]MBT5799295.1 (2Fe-2S)-binding protein [Alphaproteobacteria bacterium]MDA9190942.1 (2Fe-2S)-binding protein [Alphaproteobacteria bacterium]MDC3311760.1 (2Fe-2S)-binding protein [Alphaproteobacteria bacterium]
MPHNFFYFENQIIEFDEGMSVAAALLRKGINDFRQTQVTQQPRGPFCMMGACFDCLLVIDGLTNQQGCMYLAKQGIRVSRHPSYPLLEMI